MKRPTAASLKRVTPENLARLGVERLAAILLETAEVRPELKRRLRMELAAEQGAEHLVVEIDKRLASLETSRGRVAWRRRAVFIRDLDQLRDLISGRLAELDRPAALSRLWAFMDLFHGLSLRVRDKDGALETVFGQAAGDLGAIIENTSAAPALAEAVAQNPSGWARWLPELLAGAPAELAETTLPLLSPPSRATPAWLRIVQSLADAAGNPDVFASTFSKDALKTPPVAAQVAQRLLSAGRPSDALALLRAARPGRGSDVDFEWEGILIDALEASGETEEAQTRRWAAFERTLSVERAREFVRRLKDFEDVEAESKAFTFAAAHPDAGAGLAFLMEWPALPEAARVIATRGDELTVEPELAEAWAAKMRVRQPAAALALLRKGAAQAFRRREYVTCDRLTAEAESLETA